MLLREHFSHGMKGKWSDNHSNFQQVNWKDVSQWKNGHIIMLSLLPASSNMRVSGFLESCVPIIIFMDEKQPHEIRNLQKACKIRFEKFMKIYHENNSSRIRAVGHISYEAINTIISNSNAINDFQSI